MEASNATLSTGLRTRRLSTCSRLLPMRRAIWRRSSPRRPSGSATGNEDYLAQTRERNQYHRNQAKKLRAEGKSLRKIGEALGISPTQVSRLLPPGE
jgi:hypothetical protein